MDRIRALFRDPWPDKESKLKVTALFSLPLLLVGALGYRVLITADPITSAEAVDVFRAQAKVTDEASQRPVRRPRRATAPDRRNKPSRPSTKRHRERNVGSTAPVAAPQTSSETAAEPQRQRSSSREAKADRGWEPGTPEEGVYTWKTNGYESFNGARRRFPAETHRIITHSDRPNTWMNHHVFSKERESWTQVGTNDEGYVTLYVRNRIVFGPVTRDAEFTFDPPMLNNPVGEPQGTTWKGRWDGKTYGTYSGKILGEDTLRVDGRSVDVTVLELALRMQGEVEGTSLMRFWVSGEHHMVVREHYVQDVESGAAQYHAEWQMTVASLDPQR